MSSHHEPAHPNHDAREPLRHDWALSEVQALYRQPLLDLVFAAAAVHRRHHDPHEIQRATLLSIKTGACPEDCAYCPQSAHHHADLPPEGLLAVASVITAAGEARAAGAQRFCMGAAWREAKKGREFEQVLDMVRGVAALGMEVCVTLGMLDDGQAEALKNAGLTAYNHNLDTSEAFYGKIVTTRTFADRLATLRRVQGAGLQLCCGGIVGLGESADDRCALLQTLACLDPHPESVPVNLLVAVDGTPLADAPPADPFDLVRTVATARLLMPHSRVRLSAGREGLSREAQALCFLGGANSIFFGDKLLTTGNPEVDADEALLGHLGLSAAHGHA